MAGGELCCHQDFHRFRIFFNAGNFFQRGQSLSSLPGFQLGARLQQEGFGVFRNQSNGLGDPLQAVVGFAALQCAGAQAAVDGGRFRVLPVLPVEFSQAPLQLDVVGFQVEELLHHLHRPRDLTALEVEFRQVQILRAGLGHQPLHGVEFGQPFDRAGIVGIELGDLLEHGDPTHQETAAHVEVGQLGEVGQPFRCSVQSNVEVAECIENGLVLRVFFVELEILVDGFFQLPLRRQFLRTLDGFGFLKRHQRPQTSQIRNRADPSTSPSGVSTRAQTDRACRCGRPQRGGSFGFQKGRGSCSAACSRARHSRTGRNERRCSGVGPKRSSRSRCSRVA